MSDLLREEFEEKCREQVARLTGWGDPDWNVFDEENGTYENAWTDVAWQSFRIGRQSEKGT